MINQVNRIIADDAGGCGDSLMLLSSGRFACEARRAQRHAVEADLRRRARAVPALMCLMMQMAVAVMVPARRMIGTVVVSLRRAIVTMRDDVRIEGGRVMLMCRAIEMVVAISDDELEHQRQQREMPDQSLPRPDPAHALRPRHCSTVQSCANVML